MNELCRVRLTVQVESVVLTMIHNGNYFTLHGRTFNVFYKANLSSHHFQTMGYGSSPGTGPHFVCYLLAFSAD